ncbi:MAG: zf-HC2 domain-containing protein [Actinomycetota bacterium]|nr:zf-HC2 domain-containing protein [Actinomycetota bacterium]
MVADKFACQDLVESVTDYLEGALSPEGSDRFEEHLAECPYCATYVDQIKLTIALAGKIRHDELSAEVRAELLEAFRNQRE